MSHELEQLEPAFVRAVKAALRAYHADPDAERVSLAELIAQLEASDCVGDVREVVGELWQHDPNAELLAHWTDLKPFLTDEHWSTARDLALDALADR